MIVYWSKHQKNSKNRKIEQYWVRISFVLNENLYYIELVHSVRRLPPLVLHNFLSLHINVNGESYVYNIHPHGWLSILLAHIIDLLNYTKICKGPTHFCQALHLFLPQRHTIYLIIYVFPLFVFISFAN